MFFCEVVEHALYGSAAGFDGRFTSGVLAHGGGYVYLDWHVDDPLGESCKSAFSTVAINHNFVLIVIYLIICDERRNADFPQIFGYFLAGTSWIA